jgi:hypothetical protein
MGDIVVVDLDQQIVVAVPLLGGPPLSIAGSISILIQNRG